jgi:hypothetical protein
MRFRRARHPGFLRHPQVRFVRLAVLAAWTALVVTPLLGQSQSTTNSQSTTDTRTDGALAPASAASSQNTSAPNSAAAKGNPLPSTPKRRPYRRLPNTGAFPAVASPAAMNSTPPSADPAPALAASPTIAPDAEAPKPVPPPDRQSQVAAASEAGDTVSSECADLLKLATGLKADVDKTTKDELSVAVVRDASQIESMARKMRDDPKQH